MKTIMVMKTLRVMISVHFLLSFSPLFSQNSTRQEVPADYGYIVKIGQEVPGFEMKLTSGETVTMASLRGRVVMLQFTASWCGVCRKEMPHIEQEIWQKYRNNPRFALFGIDLDEPREKVIRFAGETGITYPLATDPGGTIFYSFAAKGAGVTRNVIVDPAGKIVFMTRLFKEQEFEQMKKVIASLLEP